jgi:SNF2 family DNA or RNA helicase
VEGSQWTIYHRITFINVAELGERIRQVRFDLVHSLDDSYADSFHLNFALPIRWAPSLPVVLYHGTKAEREELQSDIMARKKRKTSEGSSVQGGTDTANAKKLPIVITSYEIAVRDRQFLQKLRVRRRILCMHFSSKTPTRSLRIFTHRTLLQWKYLVVDEGHRLKNFNCRLIRELKALHSENRLLLTGTPLQNNLTELWSLLNFILPDVFDSLENFQSWFDFDEVVEDTQDAEMKAQVEEKVATDLVTKLHAILQPFLLRRLKTDLPNLQIPVKKQVVLYCPFTEAQKVFYDLIKMRDFDYLIQNKGKGATTRNVKIQNIIMQLRKVCNHPFQFDDIFDNFYEEFKKRTSGSEVRHYWRLWSLEKALSLSFPSCLIRSRRPSPERSRLLQRRRPQSPLTRPRHPSQSSSKRLQGANLRPITQE